MLALADVVHDRWTSLTLLASVTAIVAPLLLLRGVENGAIMAMRAEFENDPRSREVVVLGSHEFDRDFLVNLRNHPDTDFLLAEPRYLNTSYTVRRQDGRGRLVQLQFVATAAGDPVLTGQPVPRGYHEVVLSTRAAERLSAGPGDLLRTTVRRRTADGRRGVLRLSLRVVAVLPEERDYRESGYVAVQLLRALELWREGVVETASDGTLPPPETLPETPAARLRLYARSLEGAPRLRRFLEQRGIEARLREERIATLLALSDRLDALLAVFALLVGTGLAAMLAATGWQRALIRRRELAVLRLLALRRWELLLFPVSQTVVLGILGSLLALLLAWLAGPLVGGALRTSFDLAGRSFLLHPGEAAATVVVAALIAGISALAGGWQAARIEPAEVLHDA